MRAHRSLTRSVHGVTVLCYPEYGRVCEYYLQVSELGLPRQAPSVHVVYSARCGELRLHHLRSLRRASNKYYAVSEY